MKLNYYIYLIKNLGVSKVLIYLVLRVLRPLLVQKNRLQHIYREKVYWTYIYKYKTFNEIDGINQDLDQKIDRFFQKYGVKVNKYWHYCYINACGIQSEKYIPEYNYYEEIEPVFNRTIMADGYDDKNMYDLLFPEVNRPKSYLRVINGRFFDRDYEELNSVEEISKCLNSDEEYIAKPSLDGQGGQGVKKIRLKDSQAVFLGDEHIAISDLSALYKKDFIVQELVTQHKNLSTIYPHAVNTIRVMTFRYKQKYRVLSSIIRFGNLGEFVDNESSGGISCGISSDGVLKDFGIAKKIDRYEKHPYTDQKFGGTVIPNFSAVNEMAISMHKKLLYFDLASWDISIQENGEPILIEMNLMEQGINFHQGTNGPLFGDLTDEVLDIVYNHTTNH